MVTCYNIKPTLMVIFIETTNYMAKNKRSCYVSLALFLTFDILSKIPYVE